mmetsp:Transcript_15069/g.16742  ORF Transcript_15069/g.16742 Transcript_15069/m.16742 type:complete len:143 (-) Transcript_15069:505-933(-)
MDVQVPIETLPKSVLAKIFHFLDSIASFHDLSLVSKQFNRVTQDSSYWHNFKLGSFHQQRPSRQSAMLLQKATMVEMVTICFNNNLEDEDLEFIQAVCSKPQIRYLKLVELRIPMGFAENMAGWIRHHKILQVLQLEGKQVR